MKNLLKTIKNKKIKHNKIVMLARSKSNSIRMMNSQRSDTEKINLIEEGKKKKKALMRLLNSMRLLIKV